MRVLLTRPLEASRAFAETLERAGIQTAIWPITRIVPIETNVTLPPETGGLLFTSSNAVRALAKLSERRDLPVLCVGDATARAAHDAGYLNCSSAAGDVEALATLAQRSGIGRFFHARGENTAGDLVGRLARVGVTVSDAVVYRAVETGPPPADVANFFERSEIDMVTSWSPRSAAILARHLSILVSDPDTRLDHVVLVAISTAAAEPLAALDFANVAVAETPDAAAMLARIMA